MLKPILCAAATVLALQAQQFEVAAFKPTADRAQRGLIVHLPAETGYRGNNMNLTSYLMVAYQVRADQLTGPSWLDTEFFDMEGKADRTCTADELHAMMAHLLEERFHMQIHRVTKQVTGYSLVVDKGGSKMAVHDPQDLEMPPIEGPVGNQRGKNVPMQYLALYLSRNLGEIVVDNTGLTGHYDFTIQWDLPPMPPPGPPGSPAQATISGPDLYAGIIEALRKQLGLRLDKGKVPSTQIVIDHIERLADN
jgi:uncharacterized protein (TIGR03435 family)